ncbi:transposase [Streptomyces sp. NPDC056638]|uniref:transposase n=1 Tax=Streptomyces sp. NPDC056638 TaxID=3345887 RepID=UPI00367C3CBD
MEKWQLALDMLDETRSWGIEVPLAVADAGYGDAAAFRLGLTAGPADGPLCGRLVHGLLGRRRRGPGAAPRTRLSPPASTGSTDQNGPEVDRLQNYGPRSTRCRIRSKIIPLRPGTALWRGQVATW